MIRVEEIVEGAEFTVTGNDGKAMRCTVVNVWDGRATILDMGTGFKMHVDTDLFIKLADRVET